MTEPQPAPQPRPARPPAPVLFGFGWIFYLLLASAGAVWMGFQPSGLSLGRLMACAPVDVAIDLGVGVGGGLFLVFVWEGARRLHAARTIEAEMAKQIGGLDAGAAAVLALISGFAEEVFFRGAMQTAWGAAPAVVLFALAHWGPGKSFRLWTIFAALAGSLFAAAVAWRGTLLAAIVAHVLTNAVGLERLRRSGAVVSPLDS